MPGGTEAARCRGPTRDRGSTGAHGARSEPISTESTGFRLDGIEGGRCKQLLGRRGGRRERRRLRRPGIVGLAPPKVNPYGDYGTPVRLVVFGSGASPVSRHVFRDQGRSVVAGKRRRRGFHLGGGRDAVTTGGGQDTIVFDDRAGKRDVLKILDFDPMSWTFVVRQSLGRSRARIEPCCYLRGRSRQNCALRCSAASDRLPMSMNSHGALPGRAGAELSESWDSKGAGVLIQAVCPEGEAGRQCRKRFR